MIIYVYNANKVPCIRLYRVFIIRTLEQFRQADLAWIVPTQAVRRRLDLTDGFLPVVGSASATAASPSPLPLPLRDLGFFGAFFPDAAGFFEATGVLGFLELLGLVGLTFAMARLASFNMDLRVTIIEGWGAPTITECHHK